jgi:hypothetical protein
MDHAKVIVGTIHHVPAEVVHEANVRGKADLNATTKLSPLVSFRDRYVRYGKEENSRAGFRRG